jgi:hypothetical protein
MLDASLENTFELFNINLNRYREAEPQQRTIAHSSRIPKYKIIQLASLKYLAHRMQSQVESNSAIIQYTYLKAHLNFVEYTKHIERLQERLVKDVSVNMDVLLGKSVKMDKFGELALYIIK